MTTSNSPTFDWWAALKHQGLLISPTKLAEYFDASSPSLPDWLLKRLRDHITPVLAGDTDAATPLLKTIFEDLLDYPRGQWQRANQVATEESETLMNGVTVRPDWLWQSSTGSRLPIFIARPSAQLGITDDDWVDKRLGVGRSKKAVSRVLEWMRRSDTDLALLTNGRQLRLMYAGIDFDAWAEWDVDLWFESGEPADQLTALVKLLGRPTVEAEADDEDSHLVQAIKATREGQAELSDVLGERVRRAVELLVRNVDRDKLDALYADDEADNQDVYIAACRMVMRMIVVLFAEARDLLPRDDDVYDEAYGLQSLHDQLHKRAGGQTKRLKTAQSAWPRILALFDLVYSGSAHEALPIPEYGGELFRPGDETAGPVGTALEAFESAENEITDDVVFRILQLLTRSKTKVRMGRRNTWVEAPIDFSDLSTEYIGIIYEGLLDYELKRADEPMIFLNVGDEPILPFERLRKMSDDQLSDLFGELGDNKSVTLQTDTEQVTATISDDDTEAAMTEPWQTEKEIADEARTDEGDDNAARETYESIFEWAKRAIIAASIVKPPKDATEPDEWTHEFKQKLRDKARDLVPHDRVFMPGRWYLVRWGGNRKGSGTFYTRPQLVFPTVRRTLRPLCYEKQGTTKGTKDTKVKPETKPPSGNGLESTTSQRERSTHEHSARGESDSPPAETTTDDGVANDANASCSSCPSWFNFLPRKPEQILDLKVCDPAMGSGSFLIGALRYLTDALYESLHHYDCFETDGDGDHTIVRLADGRALTEADEEPIPVPPDHEDFEDRLRARLKRYVVERCIYGVDNDRLAVELGRMALWIETMNRDLPFGFLDHKLKVGNSLVGAWMDQVRDYPAVAFERSSWNGGDKGHDNGVHFDADQIGPALKTVRNELVKQPLRKVIRAGASDSFEFMSVDLDPVEVHQRVRQVFEGLHDLPVHESRKRERRYREQVEQNPAFQRLRRIFDTWCAIWFWPFDEVLESAEAVEEAKEDPQKTTEKGMLGPNATERLAEESTIPMPDGWMDLDDEQRDIIDRLRQRLHFFHWELEFPDVFNPERQGFDATVGNPPWEIEKPNSKEFFSNVDPLYRSYGKQEALDRQTEYFDRPDGHELEREWLEYKADYKSFSNWCKNRAHPFGDEKFRDHDGVRFNLMDHGYEWRDSDELHKMWLRQREDRAGFAEPDHPFRYQGSADTNSYKLFLEMARAVDDVGGRLGFIVPSGIYTDYGTQDLRELFIEHSSWEWLFSFENRRGIFKDVDGRFKFGPVILQKGGQTDRIRASFMHHDIEDWDEAERHVLDYPRERILQFSPNTKSILELRSERDLEILEKIYDNGVLLGDDSDDGWGIEYNREFDMTNDSDKFAPRPDFEDRGYQPDEYGHWLKGDWRPIEDFGFDADQHRTDPHRNHWLIQDRPEGLIVAHNGDTGLPVNEVEDVALPFYQGAMIRQFDFSQKAWLSGTGLQADWASIEWHEKWIAPQYLMQRKYLDGAEEHRIGRPIYRRVARNTDTRTLISSLIPPFPCGDKAPVISTPSLRSDAACATLLNSLALDWVTRIRVAGTQIDFHLMDELALPRLQLFRTTLLTEFILRLNCGHPVFAPLYRRLSDSPTSDKAWRNDWAITETRRAELRARLDAITADLFGLSSDNFSHILAQSDYPLNSAQTNSSRPALDATGFWRVDKEKPPELRHTVLAQVAFQDLKWLIDRMADRDAAIATFAGQRHLLDAPPSTAEIPDHPHIDPDEGWMLPDQLTLAEYGLGHDDRGENPQPVAAELGPRFYDWQLAQDPAESWEECRQHAELIEQIVPSPEETKDDGNEETDGQQQLSMDE